MFLDLWVKQLTLSTVIMMMGVNFQRLDGRGTYDYRKITITFGIDRGCCHVQIGDTR